MLRIENPDFKPPGFLFCSITCGSTGEGRVAVFYEEDLPSPMTHDRPEAFLQSSKNIFALRWHIKNHKSLWYKELRKRFARTGYKADTDGMASESRIYYSGYLRERVAAL